MASRAGPSSRSADATASAAVRPRATTTAKATADPVLRNALRYTISAREYALLHKYVITRSRALKRRAPSVETVQRIMDGPSPGKSRAGSRVAAGSGDKGKKPAATLAEATEDAAMATLSGADDYNTRAIRHALRVFVATGAVMKLWETAAARIMGNKAE